MMVVSFALIQGSKLKKNVWLKIWSQLKILVAKVYTVNWGHLINKQVDFETINALISIVSTAFMSFQDVIVQNI